MCSSGAFANFARSPAAQFRGAEGAHHGVAVTPVLGAMGRGRVVLLRPRPRTGCRHAAARHAQRLRTHRQSATPPTAHSLSQTDRAAASRWRAALRPRAGTSQWTHEPGAELSAARAPWRERCGRERASTPSPPTVCRQPQAAAQAPPCSQPPGCAPCSCCPGRRCAVSDRASCCFAQAPLIGRSDRRSWWLPHARLCWLCERLLESSAARGGRMCGSTSRRRCVWASRARRSRSPRTRCSRRPKPTARR